MGIKIGSYSVRNSYTHWYSWTTTEDDYLEKSYWARKNIFKRRIQISSEDDAQKKEFIEKLCQKYRKGNS